MQNRGKDPTSDAFKLPRRETLVLLPLVVVCSYLDLFNQSTNDVNRQFRKDISPLVEQSACPICGMCENLAEKYAVSSTVRRMLFNFYLGGGSLGHDFHS